MSNYRGVEGDLSVFNAIEQLQVQLIDFKINLNEDEICNGTEKEIQIIYDRLTVFLISYHELIYELENLSKEEIKIEELKKFLEHVKSFQEGFASFFFSIDKFNLSDTYKSNLKIMLSTQLKQSRAGASLKEFEMLREQYNDIVAAVDLPKRIANLEEKIKTLHSSKEKTQTALSISEDNIETYQLISLVTYAVLLATAPLTLLFALPYYSYRIIKEIEKKEIYEKRLENLDNTEKDIDSIKKSLQLLNQDPEKSRIKVEKEIEQNILHLKKGVKDLASMYPLRDDILERKEWKERYKL